MVEKRIEIGTGLIGACAFEKQKIIIKNVPENYMEIRSGLGKSEPKHILILPLLMEDNLIGVIELASIKEITNYDIEFTEKVSETIASSLYSAKINSKTQSLQKEYEKKVKENVDLTEQLVEIEKENKTLKRKISDYIEDRSILSLK
jgi:transcriptional regulator with GAF, ATPase, and Fis domain